MSFDVRDVSNSAWLGALLIFFIVLRILTLDALPLVDPSESRYASIAQTAVISGNWVVPEFDRGEGRIPFIGKPPLFLWLCTLSMDLFGADEWTSRLPSLLSALLILLCIYHGLRKFQSEDVSRTGVIILLSCFGFFALAGTCMYDMMLALGITLAMVAFIVACKLEGRDARAWGWMFFVGLLLGFLIKGPIALVLTLVPIVVWCFWTRSWDRAARLPWLGGISLAATLGFLFFLMLERAVPGFNHYFFVQENIGRFLSSDYGDRFGSSHETIPGMAWVFLLLTGLPWSPFFFREMYRVFVREVRRPEVHSPESELRIFLFLWAGAAPGLFTLSHAVQFTYVLPSLPPLAMLTAVYFERKFRVRRRLMTALATGVPLIGMLLPEVYEAGLMPRYSTRTVIESLDSEERAATVYFYPKQPFSALFYTRLYPLGVSLDFVNDLNYLPENALVATKKKLSPAEESVYRLRLKRKVERAWYLYRKAEPPL